MRKLLILAPLTLCLLSSCKDEAIRTYRVATDPTVDDPIGAVPEEEAPHDHAAHSDSVVWDTPADWKQEQPGQFLIAAYTPSGGGRVTVSKLAGDGGGLAANINRWRGQVGLKPVAENEAIGQSLKLADSDEVMQLFNLTSEDSGNDAEGILAAVLPLKTETWYFKFTGPVGVLREAEKTFAEFLRTIRMANSQESSPSAAPTPARPKGIEVTAPDGWKPSEGSSMRAASFTVTGPDGDSADVSVVPIPGESGSVLDNVNRWRSQLKLDPLASADDPAIGTKVPGPAGEILVSHMTSIEPILNGKKAAISTAILSRPGTTWFFKITGDAEVVEANREKFAAFVRSATFPD